MVNPRSRLPDPTSLLFSLAAGRNSTQAPTTGIPGLFDCLKPRLQRPINSNGIEAILLYLDDFREELRETKTSYTSR